VTRLTLLVVASMVGCSSRPVAGTAPQDAGEEASDATLEADPTPPAVLASVTPSHVFLARHAEVQVEGYSTDWSSANQVVLGPGITLTNLSAPAPNLLVVDFGVAPDAGTTPRDVTVVDPDGGALVDPGALALDPPVAMTFEGTLAQGSLLLAQLTVLDPSVALDTTYTVDPFGNHTYTELLPLLPPGVSATVLAATQYTADLQLFVDEGTTGPVDFDLLSGVPDGGDAFEFPLPDAMTLAARTPAALTSGAQLTGTVSSPYATGLYAYMPATAALAILDFSAGSTISSADPALLLLPASGRWSDELTGGALATWVSASTDPIYAVYFDPTGTTGAYTVGLTATPPAATAAASAADATMAGAIQATALPFVLTGGQLVSTTSQDWIEVTTGPGDSGKQLHVQSAGDPLTFLDVTVYQSDGVTSVGGNENGGPVDARVGPLAASSTYYVVFSAGAGFDPAHGGYVGVVRIQ
jgi:hypothetical protein